MGCRPSRSSLGRVADSSWEYNRKYVKDQKEKKLKSKRGGRGGRRKAPVYNDFSCTSKTYTNLNSKSSKITVRLSTDGSTLEIEQFDIDLNACVDKYKDKIIPTSRMQPQVRSPEGFQNCIYGNVQWIVRSHSAPQLTYIIPSTKVDSMNDRDTVCSKVSFKAGPSSKPKKSKSVSEKGFVVKGNVPLKKTSQQSNGHAMPGVLLNNMNNFGNKISAHGITGCTDNQNNHNDGAVYELNPYNLDTVRSSGCNRRSIQLANKREASCNNGNTCSEIIVLTDLEHNRVNDCDRSTVPISHGAPTETTQSICNCSQCCHQRAASKCNSACNCLTSEGDYVCSCSNEAVQSDTNFNQIGSSLNKFCDHEFCDKKRKSISYDVNRSKNVPKHVFADENLNFSQNSTFDWCENMPSLENDNMSTGYLNSLDSEKIKRLVSDIDYSGRNVLLPTTLTNGFKNGDNCSPVVQSPIAKSIRPSNIPDISSNNEDRTILSRGNHLVITDDIQQNSDDSFICCKTTNLKENLVAIETTDKLVGLSEGTNCVSGVPADFVFLMKTGPNDGNEINTDIDLEMVEQEVQSLEIQKGTSFGIGIISGEETDETSPEYEESLDESFEKRFDFSFYNYDMLKISSPNIGQTIADDTPSSDFDDDEFLDALESTYV